MMQIEFLTELGAKVSVQVDSPDKLLDVQRQYGKLGWTSGDVPTGGYQFPLDNAPDFDWSLIGARKWTNPEGETLVMHRGYAYKIRPMDAVDSRKMTLPACVKVSRGAKPSDRDHIREKGDGEFEYVTLAVFRGGKRLEKFAEPRQGQQQQPPQQQQDTEAPPPDRNYNQEWREATHGTIYAGGVGRAQLAEKVGESLNLPERTFADLWNLKRADVREMLINTARAWLEEDRKQAS